MVLLAGYTSTQPVKCAPGDSLKINPSTGLITFNPILSEIDAIRTTVEEYRFFPVIGSRYKIGEINRETQMIISSNSFNLAQTGPQ